MRILIIILLCFLMTGCGLFSGTGIKEVTIGGSYSLDGEPVNGDITFVFDDPKGSTPKSLTPEIKAVLPNGQKVNGYFITEGEVEATTTTISQLQRKLQEQQQASGASISSANKEIAMPAQTLTTPDIAKLKMLLKRKMEGQ